jgi:hypothetical protein
MKVRFKTSIAGAFWSFGAGEAGELPDDEAERLIAAGIAEPIVEPQQIETATTQQPELQTTAAKTTPKAKGK